MSPRKLIDVEMEQTGEALKSASYAARQVNTNTVNRRTAMTSLLNKSAGLEQFNQYPQKNPAINQNWFEAPNAEYQAWEKKGLDNELAARKTQGDQDIAYTDAIITKLRPKANDEMVRTLGNELQTRNKALGDELATRLPYNAYQNDSNRFKGAETLSSSLPGVLAGLKYNNNNVQVSF